VRWSRRDVGARSARRATTGWQGATVIVHGREVGRGAKWSRDARGRRFSTTACGEEEEKKPHRRDTEGKEVAQEVASGSNNRISLVGPTEKAGPDT